MASDNEQSSPLAEALKHTVALGDGEALCAADSAELRLALDKYPFFTAAAIALLRHSPEQHSNEAAAELRKLISCQASSSRTLAFAAKGSEWADFYPPRPEAPSKDTEDVIDTFLQTYGGCTPEEERQLERMIFNPTPDYAELLARQEQEELPDESEDGEPDSQQARINAFIRSQHPASQTRPVTEEAPEPEEHPTPISRPEAADDSLLSESLAKIFIKQGRYERAYEIISGISLKFPKKSAYFADQLRFLQKLIINQRRFAELGTPSAPEK